MALIIALVPMFALLVALTIGAEKLRLLRLGGVVLGAAAIALLDRSLPGKLLKQHRIRVATGFSLHSITRIRSDDEMGGQFLNFSFRPNQLAVLNAIASRVTKRMTIHRPQ